MPEAALTKIAYFGKGRVLHACSSGRAVIMRHRQPQSTQPVVAYALVKQYLR